MNRRNNKPFLLFIIFIGTIIIAGCLGLGNKDIIPFESPDTTSSLEEHGNSWLFSSLKDITSGNKFRVFDLMEDGRPIIIHTFAVWCPACTIQLSESCHLIETNPNTYHLLALDIDPREYPELVKNHITRNNFSGKFVILSTEDTRSLIDTFGTRIIISLPQTVIICNNTALYVGDGVYREEHLKEKIRSTCQISDSNIINNK